MSSSKVRRADLADVEALAELAAETFPMACPPELPSADIAEFIARHLSPRRFAEYLADPTHVVLVYDDGELSGYVLMMLSEAHQPDPSFGVTHAPAAYLSKCYVRATRHGGSVAAQLLEETKKVAKELGAAAIWLNTNQGNARACRFYQKHEFRVVGTRELQVGNQICQDYVFEYVIAD